MNFQLTTFCCPKSNHYFLVQYQSRSETTTFVRCTSMVYFVALCVFTRRFIASHPARFGPWHMNSSWQYITWFSVSTCFRYYHSECLRKVPTVRCTSISTNVSCLVNYFSFSSQFLFNVTLTTRSFHVLEFSYVWFDLDGDDWCL